MNHLANDNRDALETTRVTAVIACVLCLLVVGLFMGRCAMRRLLQSLPTMAMQSSPCGRVALALVGSPPSTTVMRCRLNAWLKASRWVASVVCYASTDATLQNIESSVAMWPLRLLATSTCDLALVIPWDIDLGEAWDENVHRLIPSADDVCYSFYVPGCERLHHYRRDFRDCSVPPQLVVPSQNIALQIPDFRCVVARPHLIASYAEHWFPSFFSGLLTYPLETHVPSLPPQSAPLALDPLPGTGNTDVVTLTSEDSSTLLALGISNAQQTDSPLHWDLWRLLLQKPHIYVRLPSERTTLR